MFVQLLCLLSIPDYNKLCTIHTCAVYAIRIYIRIHALPLNFLIPTLQLNYFKRKLINLYDDDDDDDFSNVKILLL